MEYVQAQPTQQFFRNGTYADYLDYVTEQYSHLFTDSEINEMVRDAYVLHLLALPRDVTTF